jgi:hypothetical protein
LFQLEPFESPPQTVDWCAIGVMQGERQGYPYSQFNASGSQGSETLTSWDQVEVQASFYGPNCFANAELLRDGLCEPQNREALQIAKVGFVEAGTITRVPELVGKLWNDRADLPLVFNRCRQRTYPVLAVLSALITLKTSNNITLTETAP